MSETDNRGRDPLAGSIDHQAELLAKVETGLAQDAQGQLLSGDEVRTRLAPVLHPPGHLPQAVGRSVKPSREVYRVLVVGAVWLIAVVFDQYTVRFLAGPPTASLVTLKAHGASITLALTATRLFGLALVLLLIRVKSNVELRASLRPKASQDHAIQIPKRRVPSWRADAHRSPPFGWLAAIFVITAICSTLLNNFDVYPFPWRWQYDQSVGFVRAYAETGHALALVFLLLVSAVASPIIEEVIFRFGLLRAIRAWSGSSIVAVLGTALVFGAAHLGYPFWRPTVGDIHNACGAAGLGLVLGTVVVRSNGRLTGAIAIHSANNFFVGVMLAFTALSS
jgi:membrane protease YdiL (CAAX protease family)